MKSLTIDERFEIQHIPEPMSGCWLWTGTLNGSGYGSIRVDGTRYCATCSGINPRPKNGE